jgi:hypothetical protein
MKTLKQLLQDAARYELLRDSNQIACGTYSNFANPGYPMNEADKQRLDAKCDELIAAKAAN